MTAEENKGFWASYDSGAELEGFYVPAELPDGSVKRGAVILLQEIFGVNLAMRSIAHDLAKEGFDVLAPDLFSHQQRRVDLGYGPDERKAGFQLMQGLDMDRAVRDIATAAHWLRSQAQSNGRVAVVGFCIGGMLAIRAGAPAEADAVVSFYGVRVHEHLEAIRALACPLQYHVGDKDGHIDAASVAALQAGTAGLPNVEVFVYPGAEHGFYNFVRTDVFNPAAFERARARAVALLNQALQR